MEIFLQIQDQVTKCGEIDGISGEFTISSSASSGSMQIFEILSGEESSFLPQKYRNFSEIFPKTDNLIPLLVPRHTLLNEIEKIKEKIESIKSSEKDRKYFEISLKIHKFLETLQPASVDIRLLEEQIEKHEVLSRSGFESFRPGKRGLARRVIYDTTGTVTGRLTVKSGPRILTTHKDVRKCIKSSFQGGKILEIDFRSIEPRIALIFSGANPPEDVYEDFLKKFPGITREIAKISTLTALYGGQINRISELMGNPVDSKRVLSFVKTYFGLDSLERKLLDQTKIGVIRNYLGRPLREATKNSRLAVNHFLQSSAAEISILLFDEICSKMGENVKPLFVIHDALILDVHPDQYENVRKICEDIYFEGIRMPVKITVLSGG